MFCASCGKETESTAKFCPHCGTGIVLGHDVQVGLDQRSHILQEVCQMCNQSVSEVRYIEFYQNIGYLVARSQRSVKGKLCKKCIKQYFWKFSITTLFLGWWGVISFFATAFFLLNNIFRYLMTLSMKSDAV